MQKKLVVCRSGAGDGARPATHGRANRGARQAPDRKRYQAADGRTDAGARRAAFDGARAGIRMPMTVMVVIATVIGRVGDPVNFHVTLVGRVPVVIVIGDGRGFAIGIAMMHAPAGAILVAGDIGPFGGLGAGDGGRHQGRARDSEKRAQTKGRVKHFHVLSFFIISRFQQALATTSGDYRSGDIPRAPKLLLVLITLIIRTASFCTSSLRVEDRAWTGRRRETQGASIMPHYLTDRRREIATVLGKLDIFNWV